MPYDFTRQRLDGVNLAGARLHMAYFGHTRVTDAEFIDTDLEGEVVSLRVNGVEVGPYVEAELDRRFPERLGLRASDPVGLQGAWQGIEARWSELVDRAEGLPEATLHEQVDGEWSFVETLRHLIFATDSWLGRMVHGELHPYHPFGLAGPWLEDPAALGLEPDADPSLAQVLAVRRGRMADVAATLDGITETELSRVCEPPGPGHPDQPTPVLRCLQVILNEEWWHRRFAERDLDALTSG